MSPEIVLTSSFRFGSFDEYAKSCNDEFDSYVYTRGTNPTTSLLEGKIAELEGGERCKVFASGMGAISATLLTFLRQGDDVLFVNTIYSATSSLLKYMERYGVTWSSISSCKTDVIASAIKASTKIIYIESPSSQKFELVDIEKIAKIARVRHIMTVIDNTWATPLFQKPLNHAVDISIQSCSKYIGGHSDIVCGAVISSKKLIRQIEEFGFLLLGSTASPLTSYLALRSLRTLPCRMRTLECSVKVVIKFLENDPRIKKIHHPLCGDAWQRKLAVKYLDGYGSLLAIDFANPDLDRFEQFINSLQLISVGVSWGGFESLVLPAYRKTNSETVLKRGLDLTHVRLYVGLEDPSDIVSDLSYALDQAYGSL
ncbi:trans-sulfuration enzyme family protein [Coriobacterium glomerans]|nr:aminotransferase class I/II-fold pyridoxal phosphate-dependent enzyme [Coriobacterium glomerans]